MGGEEDSLPLTSTTASSGIGAEDGRPQPGRAADNASTREGDVETRRGGNVTLADACGRIDEGDVEGDVAAEDEV